MLKYKLNLISGLFFELVEAWKDREYDVKFVEYRDSEKITLYETKLRNGWWGKIDRRYLADYHIEIWDGSFLREDIRVFDYIKGKKVFINFESSSLGDTIAWIPYCLEFKKKYQCEVVVSTFLNFLFKEIYTDLKFVERGVIVENIVAQLDLGWFYDFNKEPKHPATIPLQSAASNILHLDYKEIHTQVAFEPKPRPIEAKYVTISTHSTSGLKYWKKEYWQTLIDYLNDNGYKVVEISKDATDLKNLEPMHDKSLQNTMNFIYHSSFFIGLSSGLSWLSWAMNKKVIMIANFTRFDHEFQSNCVRITDESVCHGCWNNPKFKFDKGNWNYCPEHEDTPRQFECHNNIKPERIISEINKLTM
jgi:autotransporter strand-loop-strand O-heptosyltransferase